ncbi:MAG: SMC family ATPase, partial [Hyphomicrobium sp.]
DLDSQREPVASLTVRRAGARIAQSLIDVDAAASVARQKAEQSMRLHGEAGTAHRTAASGSAKAAEKLKTLDAKKSDVEALRARRRDYQSHSSKLAESLSLRTILGEADDRARTASEALRMAREHHAALVDQLRRDTAALAAAREAESGRASLARRSIDAEAAFKAAQAFETAASLLDTARDELIRAERALLEAKHARDHAANTCRVADAALLHDHAQVLAGKLVPGAACPVCGSHDHPAPARDAPENAARSDVHEQAKAAFDAATVAEAGAGKRAGIAQALTREREAQLTALTQPERSARAILDVLTALKAEIDGFGAPADLVALAAANQSLDARIATANTAFDQARTHASTCETTLALARQSLDDALKAVPPNLRQPDALQVAAKLLDDEIASYDAATADAERAARQTRDALVAAERDADHADRNRKDAEAHLVSAEAALSARLAQHGLTPDSYAAHKLDIPRIDEFDCNIKDYATRRVVVEDRARMAAAAIKDVVRPDIKLIETARDAADAAYTEATMQAITVGEHVKRLSDVQASIATEIARLDKLERDTAPLRELADAFGGKTQTRVDLETFAITTMFDAVLDAANLRLGPMTRGRYTLVRESDGRGAARRGLGIGVEDTYTGRQRPTSTLSGGETFIAALALALGLSEIVESQRGNVRLDTIFIDEGFGSLDSDGDAGTLEQVLQTLQDLVGRSRAVGLISHVPLVQQAIPNGFWITKTAGGSRIETRD